MGLRSRSGALLADAICVVVFVLVGTRNHGTDTGFSGVVSVAAPFLLALVATRAVPLVRRSPASMAAGASAWVVTVVLGMGLRSIVFDRGTAGAFVVVATVFLGVSLLGWRTAANRGESTGD